MTSFLSCLLPPREFQQVLRRAAHLVDDLPLLVLLHGLLHVLELLAMLIISSDTFDHESTLRNKFQIENKAKSRVGGKHDPYTQECLESTTG